uniref:Replication associated protein n=1 Tax=unidentified TaxID=32644 RepID=A0A6G9W0Z1_9ZZZZ|nr:replication associated protein [unidentified]
MAAVIGAREGAAKRWCFTINNPVDSDKFWEDADAREQLKYLVVQYEVGDNGTPHYQGFLILKRRVRLTTLKREFSERAHWEKTRGTDQQASDYCKKDATHPPGTLRFELGTISSGAEKRLEREALEEAAIEELESLKKKFKKPQEIIAQALMKPGFMAAYNALTADILGPHRRNLKIITMVSPPGCGKSYTIAKLFPKAARCIMGNCGVWWQNPCEKVAVIEEFAGQIQLQRMLHLLDPYPLALEVKGGMRPAMFEVLFITSNSTPEEWYANTGGDAQPQKRHDALMALYDRLGYKPAWSHQALVRTCGTYLQPAFVGAITPQAIEEARKWFYAKVLDALDMPEPVSDDDEEPGGAAAACQVSTDLLPDV